MADRDSWSEKQLKESVLLIAVSCRDDFFLHKKRKKKKDLSRNLQSKSDYGMGSTKLFQSITLNMNQIKSPVIISFFSLVSLQVSLAWKII